MKTSKTKKTFAFKRNDLRKYPMKTALIHEDDYIEKPIDPKRVISQIKRLTGETA
jgi:hypothetical protein